MENLAVKFLSAVSAGIVAIALIAMIPLGTAGAAEECLTKPKDEAPSGKHWYYRIERSTKRHCWYLRDEGETHSQADNIDTSSTSCARGSSRRGDQTAALGRRRPCRIAIATNRRRG